MNKKRFILLTDTNIKLNKDKVCLSWPTDCIYCLRTKEGPLLWRNSNLFRVVVWSQWAEMLRTCFQCNGWLLPAVLVLQPVRNSSGLPSFLTDLYWRWNSSWEHTQVYVAHSACYSDVETLPNPILRRTFFYFKLWPCRIKSIPLWSSCTSDREIFVAITLCSSAPPWIYRQQKGRLFASVKSVCSWSRKQAGGSVDSVSVETVLVSELF